MSAERLSLIPVWCMCVSPWLAGKACGVMKGTENEMMSCAQKPQQNDAAALRAFPFGTATTCLAPKFGPAALRAARNIA